MSPFRNILVVCIGNICRSPMAELLLRNSLESDVVVHSAGLGALINYPADPIAVELMKEKGLDLSAHRARQISQQLVSQADLILVMTTRQKQELEAQFFSSTGKVFLLGKWVSLDVADPYQHGRQAFERALTDIESGLEAWRKHLLPAARR